jgi:hypothetical protein
LQCPHWEHPSQGEEEEEEEEHQEGVEEEGVGLGGRHHQVVEDQEGLEEGVAQQELVQTIFQARQF